MKKQCLIDKVLDMVVDYLAGRMSRLNFTLDFPHVIQVHYAEMSREDEEFAMLIDDRLVEEGVYAGENLSDEAFRKLIKKQFLDVLEISDGRFL